MIPGVKATAEPRPMPDNSVVWSTLPELSVSTKASVRRPGYFGWKVTGTVHNGIRDFKGEQLGVPAENSIPKCKAILRVPDGDEYHKVSEAVDPRATVPNDCALPLTFVKLKSEEAPLMLTVIS